MRHSFVWRFSSENPYRIDKAQGLKGKVPSPRGNQPLDPISQKCASTSAPNKNEYAPEYCPGSAPLIVRYAERTEAPFLGWHCGHIQGQTLFVLSPIVFGWSSSSIFELIRRRSKPTRTRQSRTSIYGEIPATNKPLSLLLRCLPVKRLKTSLHRSLFY